MMNTQTTRQTLLLNKTASEPLRYDLKNQRAPQPTHNFPTFSVTQNAATITLENIKHVEDDEG